MLPVERYLEGVGVLLMRYVGTEKYCELDLVGTRRHHVPLIAGVTR